MNRSSEKKSVKAAKLEDDDDPHKEKQENVETDTPNNDEATKKDASKSIQPPGDDEVRPNWIIWSISSYAFIMLVIGLPLWWKTTEVQRAYLPYDDMLIAKEYMAEHLSLTMEVNLFGFARDSNASEAIGYFNSAYDGFKAKVFLKTVPAPAMDTLYKTPDLPSIDEKLCGHDQRAQNVLNVYYVGRADLMKLYGKTIVLGNCRSAYYISNSNKLKPERLLNVLQKLVPTVYSKVQQNKGVMESLQLPLSLGYDFLLTLIVPEPEFRNFEWNMTLAREKYLPVILGKLEELFPVTVRSQYLYYVRLNLNPEYNIPKDIYEVPHDQLPLVINPVESKLRSFVSQNNMLNFLVYVPPCIQSPLHLLGENGELLASNSFLVPQWGGIQLYNAACPEDLQKLPILHISLSQIFSTISMQVRDLFGVVKDESALPLKGNVFRDWEIDLIARKRLHELLHTTANTLESLSKLLSTIKNIVVTEEVGQEVHKSTKAMRTAVSSASQGKLNAALRHAALRHATEAYRSSETAFHHPNNLAQLYFPDDQKYAIYIPLFLPIGIPVLISLQKIFAHFFPKKKVKAD